MNPNVFEIITILVEKLLHDEDIMANEEEIIKGLVKVGYSLQDIEIAFELIFSTTEIIDLPENTDTEKYLPDSRRVLSPSERHLFSEEAQEIMAILFNERLVSLAKMEKVLQKGNSMPFYKVDIKELWYLLRTTIKDEFILTRIKNRIPSFKELNDGAKYLMQ